MDIPKIYVRKHGVINLGRQGENDVRQVVWQDVLSEWETQFGAGKVQLAVTRPEDEAPYLANIDVADGEITWTITNAETAKVGDGSCELSYIVGDAVKKSQTWTTYVCPSLTGQEPVDPPEPYQSWVDKIMQETADLKIQGVPKGGTAGQFLGKKSDEDFDTEWMDVKAGVESVNGKTGNVQLAAEDVGALPNTTEMPKPDWNENDENSANYVKNRTHYVEDDNVVIAQSSADTEWTETWYLSKDGSYKTMIDDVSLALGEIYNISFAGKTYTLECTKSTEMMSGDTFLGFNIRPATPEGPYMDMITSEVPFSMYVHNEGGYPLSEKGTIVTGGLVVITVAEYAGSVPPIEFTITKPSITVHPLDQRYLPSSTVLLDSATSTFKSPTGDDITNNVKQIVKDGASIVLAHITQNGEDADGNPVWVSDKTYDEISAAVEAGKLPVCTYPDPDSGVLGQKNGFCVYTYTMKTRYTNFLYFESQITTSALPFHRVITISDKESVSVKVYEHIMVGATEEQPGGAGYVPQPKYGDQTKFLRGDATWAEIAELPAVSSSDNGKILQVVNGEWTAVELTNANGVNF